MTLLILFARLVIVSFGLAFFAGVLAAPAAAAQTECSLTVGWEPWFPYAYTDDNNHLIGLDIELTEQLGRMSGCAIKFVSRPWSRHLKEVQSGEIAIAMGATQTAERQSYANFTRPYRIERMGVLVQKGHLATLSAKTLKDLTQLPGGKIGAVTDWEYGDQYTALKKSPQFSDWIELASRDEINLRRLDAGRLKAMLIDLVSARVLLHDLKMEQAVELHPLILSKTDIHFMVSKAAVSPEVFKRLDAAAETLKNTVEGRAIFRRYSPQ